MAEYDINFSFIESQEGKQKLDGYVPMCTPKSVINPINKACFGKDAVSAIGVSGVTITLVGATDRLRWTISEA